MSSLHLGTDNAVPFAVLLVGLTGENPGTIISAPAARHRPDGYAGPIASTIVELDKPRRGPRQHMDVPLVDLPDCIAAPADDEAPALEVTPAHLDWFLDDVRHSEHSANVKEDISANCVVSGATAPCCPTRCGCRSSRSGAVRTPAICSALHDRHARMRPRAFTLTRCSRC
jgi:hypothetical protein